MLSRAWRPDDSSQSDQPLPPRRRRWTPKRNLSTVFTTAKESIKQSIYALKPDNFSRSLQIWPESSAGPGRDQARRLAHRILNALDHPKGVDFQAFCGGVFS